jgi:hypothetical protein
MPLLNPQSPKDADLLTHAPEGRRVGTLHDPVHLLQSQRSDDDLCFSGVQMMLRTILI